MEVRVATLTELRAQLHAEHDHLWRLLSAVRHAQGEDRSTELTTLLRYLAVHEAAEEVALHNAWVSDATRERLDEEREIAEVVERLVRLSAADVGQPESDPVLTVTDDEFLVTLDQLERSLRDHSDAEEHEELPILAAELSPQHLGDMLRVLLMVREMAGGVASPVGGESFAAMRLAAQREFRAALNQLR